MIIRPTQQWTTGFEAFFISRKKTAGSNIFLYYGTGLFLFLKAFINKESLGFGVSAGFFMPLFYGG